MLDDNAVTNSAVCDDEDFLNEARNFPTVLLYSLLSIFMCLPLGILALRNTYLVSEVVIYVKYVEMIPPVDIPSLGYS